LDKIGVMLEDGRTKFKKFIAIESKKLRKQKLKR
jgi:hypothetical protein